MDSDSLIPATTVDIVLELGAFMGRRRALGAVTGRCAAGHAIALRDVRDRRLYLPLAPTWEDFCGAHMLMTRRHADRIIALLNEFGPTYFDLAEFAGITPDQYRQIQPLIDEQGLTINGDPIFLVPDNARQIHAAARRLIRQSEVENVPTRKPPVPAPLAVLLRRGHKLAAALQRLLDRTRPVADRTAIFEAVREINRALARIEGRA